MNFLLPFHCCKFVAMLVQSAALPPYRTRRGRVEMEQEKAERLRQYRREGTSFRPAITSCSVIFNKTGERQRFALGIPNLVAGAGGLRTSSRWRRASWHTTSSLAHAMTKAHILVFHGTQQIVATSREPARYVVRLAKGTDPGAIFAV
jgi:hypothetical protein